MILRKLSSSLQTHDWFSVVVEIAIVVLGVLIALQVIAWNTERQNNIDEHYYLGRLLDDIDQSIKANEEAVSILKVRSQATFEVAQKLRTGILADNNEALFKEQFSKIGAWKTGDFLDSTLFELQASGKFGVIRSKRYREQLAQFQLALSESRRGQTNLSDFQKAIELEIIPRVERDFSGAAPTLITPFSELALDHELQRYVERYASFYYHRLSYVNTLQSALHVLRIQTQKELNVSKNYNE